MLGSRARPDCRSTRQSGRSGRRWGEEPAADGEPTATGRERANAIDWKRWSQKRRHKGSEGETDLSNRTGTVVVRKRRCAEMCESTQIDSDQDLIPLDLCRQLLGDEADGLSDEDIDRVRRHVNALAHVLVELAEEAELPK